MAVKDQSTSSLFQYIHHLSVPIVEVELFRLDANIPGQLSFGIQQNRQHAALRLCAGGCCGWSEGIVSHNDPNFQLAPWGSCFSELKRMTVADAIMHHRQQRESWWVNQLEMAEIALLDLAGRLLEKPVLELLNLDGRQPVPGLFCINESDPKKAAEQARFTRKRNLTTHIKLRIYGESSIDTALVQAVRQVMGSGAYIIADANEAYSRGSDPSLEELAAQLNMLNKAGLNACENPSTLSDAEWIELQAKVGLLDLIPTQIMQPPWYTHSTVSPGKLRLYNLQPGRVGSLVDVVSVARHIQSFGAQVIIGDDSLVGPGCSIWQQIAVGLQAISVQALEKPQESDIFLQCIQAKSTKQMTDGRYGIVYDYATRDLRPGFGLQVDVPRLRKLCSAYCSI
jgi:hypothetical protein